MTRSGEHELVLDVSKIPVSNDRSGEGVSRSLLPLYLAELRAFPEAYAHLLAEWDAPAVAAARKQAAADSEEDTDDSEEDVPGTAGNRCAILAKIFEYGVDEYVMLSDGTTRALAHDALLQAYITAQRQAASPEDQAAADMARRVRRLHVLLGCYAMGRTHTADTAEPQTTTAA